MYVYIYISDHVGVKLKLVIIGKSGLGKGALYWSRVTKRKYFSGCVVVLIIIIWNGRRRSRTRDLETMEETADYHCYIQRELLSKRDKVGILSLYPSFYLSVSL
jgi:hypothetical protein